MTVMQAEALLSSDRDQDSLLAETSVWLMSRCGGLAACSSYILELHVPDTFSTQLNLVYLIPADASN